MAWVAGNEAWFLEGNTGGNVVTYINTAGAGALAAGSGKTAVVANAGTGGLRSAAAGNFSTDAATIGSFGPGAGNWTDAFARQVRVTVECDRAVTTANVLPVNVVSCLNNGGQLEVVVYNQSAAVSDNVRVKLHYTAP